MNGEVSSLPQRRARFNEDERKRGIQRRRYGRMRQVEGGSDATTTRDNGGRRERVTVDYERRRQSGQQETPAPMIDSPSS